MVRDHISTPPRKKLAPLVKVKLEPKVPAVLLADRVTEEEADRVLREASARVPAPPRWRMGQALS